MKRQYCFVEKREEVVPDDHQCHPICRELQDLTITWNNMVSSHFTHIKCNCETVFNQMLKQRSALLAIAESS